MRQNQKPPKGFELVRHHKPMSLFNPEKGIVITIQELDNRYLASPKVDSEKWDYRVIAAKNQKTKYKGCFESLSHAKEKQYELAENLE